MLENNFKIIWFIEKKLDHFNIKTFDELLTLLGVRGEEEFAKYVFLIFGEKSKYELNNNDLKHTYHKVANYTINYKDFLSTMAFYRVENIHDKLNCTFYFFEK